MAIFGLATALEEVGTDAADEEADALYLRFITEHPNSPMVEQAEKARTAFAHKRLKSSAVGGFRPDVMMYITGALQTFKEAGAQKRQLIALEIAMLGRSGLDINDPDKKYLKALPGKFILGGCICWPSRTRHFGRSTRPWTPARTSAPSTRRR